MAGTVPIVTYVLDDHDQEGQLDGEGLLGVDGACDEVGRHVGAHDFENGGLNVGVRQSLDMTVPHILLPNLERLGADRVEDGKETALES